MTETVADRSDSVEESLTAGYSGRVFLAIAIGWAGLRLGRGVLPPLLPAIIDGFEITAFGAGLALTTMTALNAAFQFLGGRLADAWSRKTVLAASLGVLLVGLTVLSGAITYPMLLVGVGLVGTAGGLFFVPMRAALADLFVARRGRAYGINEGIGSAASVAAAGVAALVLSVSVWQSAFLPGLLLAGIGLFVLHRWHRERYVVARTSLEFRETIASVFMSPRVRLLLVGYSLETFTLKGVFGFLPTFLQSQRGLSPALASGVYALLFVTGAVIMPLAGTLSDRLDRTHVAIGAVLVAALGLLGIATATATWAIVAAVVVFASGILGFPPVMQAHLMDAFADESMGRDFGGFKTVYIAAGSVGPAFVGFVASSWGYAPAFAILAGCLVASAVTIAWVVRGPH